jgi:hypothetical protein
MQGLVLSETNYTRHKMLRWEDPILLKVTGSEDPLYRQQISILMDEATNLMSREYRYVRDNEMADFHIEFLRDEGFLINNVDFASCYAKVDTDGKTLTGALVRISLAKEHLVAHCIAHEIYHGLGMAHSHSLPSVVNYKLRERSLTKWDRLALKTLYDHRLQSGMTRLEALPIARELITETLAKGQ